MGGILLGWGCFWWGWGVWVWVGLWVWGWGGFCGVLWVSCVVFGVGVWVWFGWCWGGLWLGVVWCWGGLGLLLGVVLWGVWLCWVGCFVLPVTHAC
ncbi:hypothetical protein [Pseudomonas syringae group genomosp. 7]|uniref:hypothetical protein n=1 Tax=Pseudomonas syringae group genomosp. 7 TaxID=251699 RepID=UPI00377074B1